MDNVFKQKLVQLLNSIFDSQTVKLLSKAREIVPTVTPEDVLQPMDDVKLEENASFRFEEGVLFGMGEMKAAVLALIKDVQEEIN